MALANIKRTGQKRPHSLSQNFLIDQNIVQKMCSVAEVTSNDTIFEIGSGYGAITKTLLEQGAKVIAVEKDPSLAAHVKKWSCERLEVHTLDALSFPLETLQGPLKVISNLPFHITTPFLLKYGPCYPIFSTLTLIVQEEVAKKLVQNDGGEFDFLSLFLQAYGSLHYCFPVKSSSFFPKPSVESAVIQLKLHPFRFPFPAAPFFQFVQLAFGKKRKMLRSSLKDRYSTTALEAGANSIGLSLDRRPGRLALDEFANLFITLRKQKGN